MAIALSTTARLNYICPKCGAKKGDYCKTPKGRLCKGVGGIHGERMQFLTKAEHDLAKVKCINGYEWIKSMRGK